MDTLDLLTGARPACAPLPPLTSKDCPTWCEDARLKLDACGGEHMARPADFAATAGGFQTCDDGAMVPMVTVYAHRSGTKREVALCIHNPLKEAPDSRYQWLDCRMTPQEAREVAAALLAHAEISERS